MFGLMLAALLFTGCAGPVAPIGADKVTTRQAYAQVEANALSTGRPSADTVSILHRFDLDGLKIDRSFVSNIGANGERSEIVRTIVALANNLGMEVIAEGVETPGQVSTLRSVGCDLVQGYLFGGALSAEEMGERFSAGGLV